MTREQIQWTYNHAERITNKYLELFPLSDDGWEQFVDEIDEIYKTSKGNKVVQDVLMEVATFFDKLDAIYRRETK